MEKNTDQQANAGQKPVIVIVHAAWQAPYAWGAVKGQLEGKGATVLVPQLPGHGDDPADPKTTHLSTYIDFVCGQVKAVGRPVTLVGHSLAGMIISGVAEQIPDQIRELVYVAAYVPQNGESAYQISGSDKQSQLSASLIVSEDQTLFDIVKADIGNIFCQDASADALQSILDHYRAEPAAPFGEPVELSSENFGRVNKTYIETLQDHGIGHNLQAEMIAAAGIQKTWQLDTGHTPSLSAPEKVTGILWEIAQF